MKKKLFKHGNSRAIVIDKPILELLGINDKTELKISIEDNRLIITPIYKEKNQTKKRTISSNKRMQKAFEQTITKYDKTLKKLAKN